MQTHGNARAHKHILTHSYTTSKWMLKTRKPPADSFNEKITLKGVLLERVDKFKYLGSAAIEFKTLQQGHVQPFNKGMCSPAIMTCAAALQAISSLNKVWHR